MATGRRINFTPATRQEIARRAAFFCSRPECRRLTISAKVRADASKTTGVGAHIFAAAQGGPRPVKARGKQLGSVENGIWLCSECSVLIDKDADAFPAKLLHHWKSVHEEFVRTLAELGLAEALRVPPRLDPSAVARRAVQVLEDRRVLYNLFEFEVPRFCADSVSHIRRELTHLRGDVTSRGELDLRLSAMLLASRQLLDDVGPLTDERSGYPADSWEERRALFARLAAYRKVMGLHVAWLCAAYGIPASDELRGIFPEEPSIDVDAD